MKLSQGLYFAIGISMMPLLGQWFWPSIGKIGFVLLVAITCVYSALMSILIHWVINSIFWRLITTGISGILIICVLFPILDYSPFILAVLGIIFLSGTMQFFDSIKEAFPEVDGSEVKRWLEVCLTIFTIFVSSMMVGFTIGWNNLYGEALKGTIERRIVITGVNANIIITMFYWVGAILIFLSGANHIWAGREALETKKCSIAEKESDST